MSLSTLFALWLTAAAAVPDVAEIVRRTRETLAQETVGMVCRLAMVAIQGDGDGKPENDIRSEIEETHGPGRHIERTVLHASRNGKDTTAEARQKEAKRRADRQAGKDRGPGGRRFGSDANDLSPFSVERAADHRFDLLRQETLWGRPAYVVKVSALKTKETSANGTVWIDAEHFVPLKGEYTLAKLPRFVTWLKVQTQHVPFAGGTAAPSLLKIDGAGGVPLFRKTFTSTMRWTGCHRGRAASPPSP